MLSWLHLRSRSSLVPGLLTFLMCGTALAQEEDSEGSDSRTTGVAGALRPAMELHARSAGQPSSTSDRHRRSMARTETSCRHRYSWSAPGFTFFRPTWSASIYDLRLTERARLLAYVGDAPSPAPPREAEEGDEQNEGDGE